MYTAYRHAAGADARRGKVGGRVDFVIAAFRCRGGSLSARRKVWRGSVSRAWPIKSCLLRRTHERQSWYHRERSVRASSMVVSARSEHAPFSITRTIAVPAIPLVQVYSNEAGFWNLRLVSD